MSSLANFKAQHKRAIFLARMYMTNNFFIDQFFLEKSYKPELVKYLTNFMTISVQNQFQNQ